MTRIALIEDDPHITEMVGDFLRRRNYQLRSKADGISGLRLCEEWQPELVLLDLMLPGMDGESFLHTLRLKSAVPVIVLSAKTMVSSRIALLKDGADDYLTKPFDLYELLARIEATLRRANPTHQSTQPLRWGPFLLEEGGLFYEGEALPLTATELAIVRLFLTQPTKIYTKQNLVASLREHDDATCIGTLQSHISNLRKKLAAAGAPELIETVWGIGYKLKPVSGEILEKDGLS